MYYWNGSNGIWNGDTTKLKAISTLLQCSSLHVMDSLIQKSYPLPISRLLCGFFLSPTFDSIQFGST